MMLMMTAHIETIVYHCVLTILPLQYNITTTSARQIINRTKKRNSRNVVED